MNQVKHTACTLTTLALVMSGSVPWFSCMQLHAQVFHLANDEWAPFKGTVTGFDYETGNYTVEFADEKWDGTQVRCVGLVSTSKIR